MGDAEKLYELVAPFLEGRELREPVDVLLVLDRSQSMTYNIAEDCYCTGTPAGSATRPA